MNSHEIFRALQAGELDLEAAREKLSQTSRSELNPLAASFTPGMIQTPKSEPLQANRGAIPEPIAIIGMSGRYPEAPDLGKYWDNLVNARNSIREIPKSRWEVEQYYDPNPSRTGKTYCKWIGLLDEVEYFDPLFFNISPAEAESMDPQHRIFLQEAYKAFEDAGYGSQLLLSNAKCGVYFGVMNNDYAMLLLQNRAGLGNATGNSNAIAAARIAYFLNLKGPAIAIDTACSSALVAVHLACQALRGREINLALVGGATLYLMPEAYLGMSSAGMLSPDGQCKAFDNGANGFVPGEGVGALVLKRLRDAQADHDHIYGVVLGSGINQDGKTNGITAPSANSQMELEREVYEKYGIDPESISYVEMHGTGTKLGDPIELEALATVYREKTDRQKYCAIGSVKSNIGHTSAAAGTASIQKVLLAMNQATLVPTLHYQRPNEHFDFENSPFYVNTELKPWETRDGKPRRAAISSFGYSGTNAHLVIEEYVEGMDRQLPVAPVLFILSAKGEAELVNYAGRMKDWIQSHEPNLTNLAYTLQVGREALDYRLAFLADSRTALLAALERFVKNVPGAEVMLGQVSKGKERMNFFETDDDAKTLLHTWIQKQNLKRIAELWVKGMSFDWNQLYTDHHPYRLSLPTYPFRKEIIWASGAHHAGQPDGSGHRSAVLHPLVHKNTSDFFTQRYSSIFSGNEPFLADHQVNGRRLMPGAACLEMVRAAVALADGGENASTGVCLKNVVWNLPIEFKGIPVQVEIGLERGDRGTVGFEIFRKGSEAGGGADEVYSWGDAELDGLGQVPQIDLPGIRSRCQKGSVNGAECYGRFETLGIQYGPSLQGIESLFTGAGEVLARLGLPAANNESETGFFLVPGLIDAAFQAAVGLFEAGDLRQTVVPVGLQEMKIYRETPYSGWAWVRWSQGGAQNSSGDAPVAILDIDVCDDAGRGCVQIRGLTLQGMLNGTAVVPAFTGVSTLLVGPVWEESQAGFAGNAVSPSQTDVERWVILCEPGENWEAEIRTKLDAVAPPHYVLLQSELADLAQRYQAYALQLLEVLQALLANPQITKALLQLVVFGSSAQKQLFTGLYGLIATAGLENPKLSGQVIELDGAEALEGIAGELNHDCGAMHQKRIQYRDGKRWVGGWKIEATPPDVNALLWREKGVYLITGGVGGLGLVFAREIATQGKAITIVLTGRGPLSREKELRIRELATDRVRIAYRQTDVTDPSAMEDLIQGIVTEFGGLNGILHSAGLIRDNFIIKKTGTELSAVLAPKVAGLVNLDTVTRDLDLDFMVLFSSIAGSIHNPGQSDYAAANAFMDRFSGYRNHLAALQQRHGRTLAINWPLWEEGGMTLEPEAMAQMQRLGMVALDTGSGMEAFYRSMALNLNQVMVLRGNVNQLRDHFLTPKPTQSSDRRAEGQAATGKETAAVAIGQVINELKELFSSVIKLPPDRIEAEVPLENYGIDSVMIMKLTYQLENTFGALPKTLLFEYQNLRDLAGYFRANYPEKFGEQEHPSTRLVGQRDSVANSSTARPERVGRRRSRFGAARSELPPETSLAEQPEIAIIGVAGRYPGARNLQDFWNNLRDGKDSITEIPPDRWDHSRYFSVDQNAPGKTYGKWGGFLDGVAEFDPLFFNISPLEAELMDPQERLFLECVHATLEDAGYTRDTLRQVRGSGLEGNVGVFVGVMYEEYPLYGAQEQALGNPLILSGSPASIANRVSYFFNFHGPSMAIDTMCSSSLTAIHLACQSLQRHGCELAIAGGVNVSIHPNKYLALGRGKFISGKGRCESFGQGGDGYVPGEGVGAVLLKPLARAVADGDQIYGVIKATAVNHGGKTNGYSVPNPSAQADVIGRAIQEAGLHPRTVSYIEAHGTGTVLGDPIEIAGLSKAFASYTPDKQFCAIGSVKSNIGHGESAAGIGGVTKVLLQLKHQQLVPSLHSRELNPHIEFANTPFVVQQELTPWKRPEVELEGLVREYPRRAGVSAFGAGGSNAHIIIEEYLADQPTEAASLPQRTPAIIVLSAKDEARLREQARQMLVYLREQPLPEWRLADVAYTLQTGREAMEERLAFLAVSLREMATKLEGFLQNKTGVWRGQVKGNKEALAVFTDDEELQEAITKWVARGKYEKLIDLWVKGLFTDWTMFYQANQPHRVSLPTYPFARERYWAPQTRRGQIPPLPANISHSESTVTVFPERAPSNIGQVKEHLQRVLQAKSDTLTRLYSNLSSPGEVFPEEA